MFSVCYIPGCRSHFASSAVLGHSPNKKHKILGYIHKNRQLHK